MEPVILSRHSDTADPSNSSSRDIRQSLTAAQMAGIRIVDLTDDLSQIPTLPNTTGFWISFLPSLPAYEAMHAAAQEKGIQLINTPAQHSLAMEFSQFYPVLEGITPESRILTSPDSAREVGEALGYPLFVKGGIQSNKAKGLASCIANNQEELGRLITATLQQPQRARGKVIVRKFTPLRHTRESPEGFPFGREYRVFLLNAQIVTLGYYWEGTDPLRDLTRMERAQVEALAVESAERLGVPFLTVDIGQTENGDWVVIEVGDGQFAGLSQISPIGFWNLLAGKCREMA